jgi:hypothetical protein
MLKHAAILTCALATATAAHAGIDFDYTDRGGTVLTGGRGEIESFGLQQLLWDENNSLVAPDTTLMHATGIIDNALGLEEDDLVGEGYLVKGPGDTLLAYDRLAYQRVVQVLGFDRSEPAVQFEVLPPPPLAVQPEYDTSFRGSQDDSSAQQLITPDNVIPEPATATMWLTLGGLLLMRRPRRKQPAT